MAKIVFDEEKELQACGMFAPEGLWYGFPYFPVECLNTPITQKENVKRLYAGEEVEWIPNLINDQLDVTPICVPDVAASGMEGGIDSFGVEWVALENGLPAMVKPGNPLLKDIADRQDLTWPDVDSWDWEGAGKEFLDSIDERRMIRGTMLSTYFERLIALMDFENAAMALIEDPESVNEFFEKLTEYNIDIVDHYIKYFHVDAIMAHDDWSAQHSPFFSASVASELILPHLKKLVQHCHDKGLYFTLHSCGNGRKLAPVIVEAGVDGWQLQENAMDYDELIDLYSDKIVLEAGLILPDDDDEAKAYVDRMAKIVARAKKPGANFYDMTETRGFDSHKYIYSALRKAALGKM